jgi:membrane protease YdiL (CAAX protease family)
MSIWPTVASAGIFALVHLMYGLPYALTVFVSGLALGFLFLQSKSIMPLMLAHALLDYMIVFT